jgi:hypothetical protein
MRAFINPMTPDPITAIFFYLLCIFKVASLTAYIALPGAKETPAPPCP